MRLALSVRFSFQNSSTQVITWSGSAARTRAREAADGVHTAFDHDFSNLKQTSEHDRKAIETLGEVLPARIGR